MVMFFSVMHNYLINGSGIALANSITNITVWENKENLHVFLKK